MIVTTVYFRDGPLHLHKCVVPEPLPPILQFEASYTLPGKAGDPVFVPIVPTNLATYQRIGGDVYCFTGFTMLLSEPYGESEDAP